MGTKVTRFKIGDNVFGDNFDRMGGFAEYVCAPEKVLMPIPLGMSFVEASTLPQAGCIALQGIRDKGKVTAGQQVLINGAGGGSGSFAIQLAKMLGAHVTAVDNTEKLEAMRALGADDVIDYTCDDFTKIGSRYDLILDLSAYHSIADYKRVLKPNGRYLMVGGSVALMSKLLLRSIWSIIVGGKKLGILAMKPNQDLNSIIELFAAGELKLSIDKTYSLNETAQALAYLGEGHVKGKLVIQFE